MLLKPEDREIDMAAFLIFFAIVKVTGIDIKISPVSSMFLSFIKAE